MKISIKNPITITITIIIITSVILISGCTTVEFVRKDLTPKKQAVLRYLATSSADREAEYREKVKAMATEFCNGGYEIVKEYQAREENGSSVGLGTGVRVNRSSSIFVGTSDRGTTMYNFIEIVCLR